MHQTFVTIWVSGWVQANKNLVLKQPNNDPPPPPASPSLSKWLAESIVFANVF